MSNESSVKRNEPFFVITQLWETGKFRLEPLKIVLVLMGTRSEEQTAEKARVVQVVQEVQKAPEVQ